MAKRDQIRFCKMQGGGNDFVLIEGIGKRLNYDFSLLSPKICHRHFGIGADGVLLVLPSKSADFKMRMFNPDGSEAEMCGNGIRCFAKYVYQMGWTKKKKIRVETLAGEVVPELIMENNKIKLIKVNLGPPRLKREEIPMKSAGESVINEDLKVEDKIYKITALSLGNPHCVIFERYLDNIPLSQIGPKIENHYLFPQRTNVEFVKVINPTEIKVRIWERGAGETLSCGTGAGASVVASVLNKKTKKNVWVNLPGGKLKIEWGEDNNIYLTGPAEEVFSGVYFVPKF